jgi:hypothetical protein
MLFLRIFSSELSFSEIIVLYLQQDSKILINDKRY